MAQRLATGNYDQLHHFIAMASGTHHRRNLSCSTRRNGLSAARMRCWLLMTLQCRRRGDRSVGVAAQYASALGKTANCQTLVSLTLARGEVPVNRDAASGVDGQSTKQFASEVEKRVAEICAQLKEGTYRAPPVRRVEIPKGPGKVGTRPLGIPTSPTGCCSRRSRAFSRLCSKPISSIAVTVFEPGRNLHHALQALRRHIVTKKVSHVFKADICSYITRIE